MGATRDDHQLGCVGLWRRWLLRVEGMALTAPTHAWKCQRADIGADIELVVVKARPQMAEMGVVGWFDWLAEWVYLFGPKPRGYDWTTGRSGSPTYKMIWWYGRILVWLTFAAIVVFLIWAWYLT